MCPNDAEGVANSVDPDQTAPLGAVSTGSTLSVYHQADLSENRIITVIVISLF